MTSFTFVSVVDCVGS